MQSLYSIRASILVAEHQHAMAGHVDQARHIVAMCVPRMAPDVQARQGNYQLGKATFGKARQHCRFVVCLHAASGRRETSQSTRYCTYYNVTVP